MPKKIERFSSTFLQYIFIEHDFAFKQNCWYFCTIVLFWIQKVALKFSTCHWEKKEWVNKISAHKTYRMHRHTALGGVHSCKFYLSLIKLFIQLTTLLQYTFLKWSVCTMNTLNLCTFIFTKIRFFSCPKVYFLAQWHQI